MATTGTMGSHPLGIECKMARYMCTGDELVKELDDWAVKFPRSVECPGCSLFIPELSICRYLTARGG